MPDRFDGWAKNIGTESVGSRMATKCGNCGTEVAGDASQCPGCGAVFDDGGGSFVGSLPPSWVAVGVGFALFVVLAVLRLVSPVVMVGLGAGGALVAWVLAEFVS